MKQGMLSSREWCRTCSMLKKHRHVNKTKTVLSFFVNFKERTRKEPEIHVLNNINTYKKKVIKSEFKV